MTLWNTQKLLLTTNCDPGHVPFQQNFPTTAEDSHSSSDDENAEHRSSVDDADTYLPTNIPWTQDSDEPEALVFFGVDEAGLSRFTYAMDVAPIDQTLFADFDGDFVNAVISRARYTPGLSCAASALDEVQPLVGQQVNGGRTNEIVNSQNPERAWQATLCEHTLCCTRCGSEFTSFEFTSFDSQALSIFSPCVRNIAHGAIITAAVVATRALVKATCANLLRGQQHALPTRLTTFQPLSSKKTTESSATAQSPAETAGKNALIVCDTAITRIITKNMSSLSYSMPNTAPDKEEMAVKKALEAC